jgi:hypothetical protein
MSDCTETEQDWQPVRIVSFERMREIHPDGSSGMQKYAAGKIVRVRPNGKCSPHGHCGAARSYRVHPDDAAIIVDGGGLQLEVCEHQILAD